MLMRTVTSSNCSSVRLRRRRDPGAVARFPGPAGRSIPEPGHRRTHRPCVCRPTSPRPARPAERPGPGRQVGALLWLQPSSRGKCSALATSWC